MIANLSDPGAAARLTQSRRIEALESVNAQLHARLAQLERDLAESLDIRQSLQAALDVRVAQIAELRVEVAQARGQAEHLRAVNAMYRESQELPFSDPPEEES